MPAWSCQPCLGANRPPLSTPNPSSSQGPFVSTDQCLWWSADTAAQDISSPKLKCKQKRITNSDAQMETSYPANLSPSDHPIFDGLLTPRLFTRTPIALRSFATEAVPVQHGSAVPNQINDKLERRRSKRSGQQMARHRTTPVTLEEIREVDEEMYAKQQPMDDSATGKRNSPYNTTFNYGNKKGIDFRCTYMTKTKLLPSRALWPNNHNNVHRHRSHESLAQINVHHLPTIPEEWRQQYQQQKCAVQKNTTEIGGTAPEAILNEG